MRKVDPILRMNHASAINNEKTKENYSLNEFMAFHSKFKYFVEYPQ